MLKKSFFVLLAVLLSAVSFMAPAYASMAGDLDGDGTVSPEDARLTLRAAVRLEIIEKSLADFQVADVDRNGEIEPADARHILRASVGLEDLEELARTPVMVICAGAKSILDLGLTLEYLETKGVPVLGYGTEELPAFYTRQSGFRVDYRADSPEELAEAFRTQETLGLGGGMLVTNPIPEEYSMPAEVINAAIDQAIRESREQGIKGKETTPFLLARVAELTGGDSLASNIQLVLNNAALAARTASAYSRQR